MICIVQVNSVQLIVESYKKSRQHDSHCNVATVRSGNCIGGGDWTKDRIVKDCVEAEHIKIKN